MAPARAVSPLPDESYEKVPTEYPDQPGAGRQADAEEAARWWVETLPRGRVVITGRRVVHRVGCWAGRPPAENEHLDTAAALRVLAASDALGCEACGGDRLAAEHKS